MWFYHQRLNRVFTNFFVISYDKSTCACFYYQLHMVCSNHAHSIRLELSSTHFAPFQFESFLLCSSCSLICISHLFHRRSHESCAILIRMKKKTNTCTTHTRSKFKKSVTQVTTMCYTRFKVCIYHRNFNLMWMINIFLGWKGSMS